MNSSPRTACSREHREFGRQPPLLQHSPTLCSVRAVLARNYPIRRRQVPTTDSPMWNLIWHEQRGAFRPLVNRSTDQQLFAIETVSIVASMTPPQAAQPRVSSLNRRPIKENKQPLPPLKSTLSTNTSAHLWSKLWSPSHSAS